MRARASAIKIRNLAPLTGFTDAEMVTVRRRLARLRQTAAFLCGILALTVPLSAHAQGYPSRPVTLVVPFPPGGSTDILARLLGHQLSEEFGQSVIVENRGGAGGSIASEAVARSKPDGHTLMMGHIGTLAVNVGLYSKLGYDPVRSFAPITTVARVANVLVVHPDVPARSVAELIAYARKNPGGLNFSSGGNGSAAHIAMAAFADAAGLDLVHVPYRGTAPSVTDLIGGRVQMTMTGAPAVLEYVRRGTLRALGVSTPERLASVPDIPTIAEAGLPGFEASQWYGVVAPAGTPEPSWRSSTPRSAARWRRRRSSRRWRATVLPPGLERPTSSGYISSPK